MKTLIFDIDGTLTDLWPIERSVLLSLLGGSNENDLEVLKKSGQYDNYTIFRTISKKKLTKAQYFILYNRAFSTLAKKNLLPQPQKYLIVSWVLQNRSKYQFVYATGGQRDEALYVLRKLGIVQFFDLQNSVDKTSCRFSKKTGIPFKRIKARYRDCLLITDSTSDCEGAAKLKIPYQLIKSDSAFHISFDFV